MTREEAIKELKNIKENIFWGDEYGVCFRDEWVEAYEMAISALREQSNCIESESINRTESDTVKRVEIEHVKPVWISVEERLPERTMPPHDVLVYHNLGCGMFVDRAWYSYEKNRWRCHVGMNLKVTHWMPLPEPPKGE